jgi:hypothetical protein
MLPPKGSASHLKHLYDIGGFNLNQTLTRADAAEVFLHNAAK